MIATLVLAAVLHVTAPQGITPSVVCSPTLAGFFTSTYVAPIRPWPGGVMGAYVYPSRTIYLSPQTCTDLAELPNGYTWQRGYAVHVLAHEVTHALEGPDEANADCGGALRAPAFAYLLGLRGHRAYAELSGSFMRRAWGYENVPDACWP